VLPGGKTQNWTPIQIIIIIHFILLRGAEFFELWLYVPDMLILRVLKWVKEIQTLQRLRCTHFSLSDPKQFLFKSKGTRNNDLFLMFSIIFQYRNESAMRSMWRMNTVGR